MISPRRTGCPLFSRWVFPTGLHEMGQGTLGSFITESRFVPQVRRTLGISCKAPKLTMPCQLHPLVRWRPTQCPCRWLVLLSPAKPRHHTTHRPDGSTALLSQGRRSQLHNLYLPGASLKSEANCATAPCRKHRKASEPYLPDASTRVAGRGSGTKPPQRTGNPRIRPGPADTFRPSANSAGLRRNVPVVRLLHPVTETPSREATPLSLHRVQRTPGISCEPVRTAAKRRNARRGASVSPGASERFVSFIPLLGGLALTTGPGQPEPCTRSRPCGRAGR